MISTEYKDIIIDSINTYETPQFLCFEKILEDSIKDIMSIKSKLPIKHWYSVKTQPIKNYLLTAKKYEMGMEVVSEFEFLAALDMGFSPEEILVNGPAKWHWIYKYKLKHLNVIFDSLNDMKFLIKSANEYEWNIGIRLAVNSSRDPDNPLYPGQFGMTKDELIKALKILKDNRLSPEIIHFHCRTMIPSITYYFDAINEISQTCTDNGFEPHILDIGGGLPVSSAKYREEEIEFININEFGTKLSQFIIESMPYIQKIWMENGRFITSSSSVLIVKVLDIKERENTRYLICDGGRINHSMVSDWEYHEIEVLSKKDTMNVFTTICGPTCMAYDFLQRQNLPKNLSIGDVIIWKDAGAYHIPWETKFSMGLAPVIWCDMKKNLTCIRKREDFKKWWNIWKQEV